MNIAGYSVDLFFNIDNRNRVFYIFSDKLIQDKIDSFYLDSRSDFQNYSLKPEDLIKCYIYECGVLEIIKQGNGRNVFVSQYLTAIIKKAKEKGDYLLIFNFIPFSECSIEEVNGYINDEEARKYLREAYDKKNKFDAFCNDVSDSNISRINEYVFFENGKKVDEIFLLKYLIVNCPTTNEKIRLLQEKYYKFKIKQIMDNNGGKAALSKKESTMISIPFLRQFFMKYGFYSHLDIKQYIPFIYCHDNISGYANYGSEDYVVRFAPYKTDNELFHSFLSAPLHEARHAVQHLIIDKSQFMDNIFDSYTYEKDKYCFATPDIKYLSAHLFFVYHEITKRENYIANWVGLYDEQDAELYAYRYLAETMQNIGYGGCLDSMLIEIEQRVLGSFYKDSQGNYVLLWDYYVRKVDEIIKNNKYVMQNKIFPELKMLYRKDFQHKPLVELLKDYSPEELALNMDFFTSNFMFNYIRGRINQGELKDVIADMQANIDENSNICQNIVCILNLCASEIELACKNLDRIIALFKGKIENEEIVIDYAKSLIVRIDMQMKVISQLAPLMKDYVNIKDKIKYVIDRNVNLVREIRKKFDVLILKKRNISPRIQAIYEMYRELFPEKKSDKQVDKNNIWNKDTLFDQISRRFYDAKDFFNGEQMIQNYEEEYLFTMSEIYDDICAKIKAELQAKGLPVESYLKVMSKKVRNNFLHVYHIYKNDPTKDHEFILTLTSTKTNNVVYTFDLGHYFYELIKNRGDNYISNAKIM